MGTKSVLEYLSPTLTHDYHVICITQSTSNHQELSITTERQRILQSSSNTDVFDKTETMLTETYSIFSFIKLGSIKKTTCRKNE